MSQINIIVTIISASATFMVVLLTVSIYIYYNKKLQIIDPKTRSIAELENQIILKQSEKEQLEEWKSEQEDELLEIENERKEQEILRGELSKLESDLSEKKKENQAQVDAVGNLENQRHLIVKNIEELEKKKSEIEKNINDLDKNKESSQDDVKEIEKELKELNKDQAKLKNEIDKANNKKDTLEKDHKDLMEQIKETEQRLQKINNEAEVKQKEVENLTEEALQKNKEIRDLSDTQIKLDTEVKSLSDKLKTIGTIPKEAFDSLKNPIIKSSDQSTKNDLSEADALKRLYKLTEDRGFELPKRLQNAFHTSLKTSDISCLTVMAGVSGTGKSAYPEIYSQAMGVHFLPLAVEPRWDSPQDLFGFLNYMENRFEATTLGRALRQFDNSPNSSSEFKDQLIIVLLDEMNLAKIEYYFSEFLSKLEMRRNVNLEQIDSLRKVSTEIFSGNKEDKEKGIEKSDPIFLYAGTNVLFVGTMNEDETTQSLSDKVIDRANVLSFGKPNRLKFISQNTDNTYKWEPISVDNWKKWLVEPNENSITDYDEIDNLLNDINETLYKLGRPFGWRTYKAMMTYIANHPSVSIDKNSGMQALSDQVTMRIMPKLRGLDITENTEIFVELKNHIEKINDTSLDLAFNSARDEQKSNFFDWRGISWK